jgi:integrase
MQTKKVIISDRFKLREQYPLFAKQRLLDAETGGNLTSEGVRRYDAFWRNYLHNTMPDVYLDQLRNKDIEQLIKDLYQKHQVTYRTVWNIVSSIKTFLRWCISKDLIETSPVLQWTWVNYRHLQPKDTDKTRATLITQEQCQDLIDALIANKDKDYKSSYKLMLITSLAFTGLRLTELLGLQYDHIDLENQLIHIQGRYNFREGYFVEKKKNKGSKRAIDIVDQYVPLLKWWIYLNKDHPSKYLFPAFRGEGPISEYKARIMVWQTYEENNLAELKWNRNKTSITYKIISSPFKGCPTKTFRHYMATSLINAMSSDPALNKNNIKNAMGHDVWATTEEIYGNHVAQLPTEKRRLVRQSIGKAINLKIN